MQTEKQRIGVRLNKDQMARILELRAEGKSQHEISAILGVSVGSIGRHVRAAKSKGMAFPPVKGESLVSHQLLMMRKMRREGIPPVVIAKECGVALATVYKKTAKPKTEEKLKSIKEHLQNPDSQWTKVINSAKPAPSPEPTDAIVLRLKIENEILRDLVLRHMAGAK